MNRSHRMSLSEYEERYYFPSLSQDVPTTLSTRMSLTMKSDPTDIDKTAWRNGCRYACNFCPKTMSNKIAMMLHSSRDHRKYGGARSYRLTQVVTHECLICKKHVVQESGSLADHMNRSHGINLAAYEVKYYFPSLSQESSR